MNEYILLKCSLLLLSTCLLVCTDELRHRWLVWQWFSWFTFKTFCFAVLLQYLYQCILFIFVGIRWAAWIWGLVAFTDFAKLSSIFEFLPPVNYFFSLEQRSLSYGRASSVYHSHSCLLVSFSHSSSLSLLCNLYSSLIIFLNSYNFQVISYHVSKHYSPNCTSHWIQNLYLSF